MTTNYNNMNSITEAINKMDKISENLRVEEFTEDSSKYFEKSQIKGISFKFEKFVINANLKNEINEKNFINNVNSQSQKYSSSEINRRTENQHKETQSSKENQNGNNYTNNNQPVRNYNEAQDFEASNNLSNFSNFKTNKFIVIQDSEKTNLTNNKNIESLILKNLEISKNEKTHKKEYNDNYFKEETNEENKDLKINLKNIEVKKKEILNNSLKTYNINFTNNIIDLSNKIIAVPEMDLITNYLKVDSTKFQCEEFKICGQILSSKSIQNISSFFLYNNSLKYLDLSGCEIGDLGCRHLSEAFQKNKNLSEINLQKNCIGEIGAEILCDLIISNENISKLELEHNFIGNKGAEKLFDAIKKSFKVKWLNLFENESRKNILLQNCNKNSEAQDILSRQNKNTVDQAGQVILPYAYPTFDVSFKMLFGQSNNKEILISLLNSLLDLKGDNRIDTVEINPKAFPVSNISNKKEETGMESAIDVLCTNGNNQHIAVEINCRENEDFTREQVCMAELIAGQDKQPHIRFLATYIIVIYKNNIFTGNTAISEQNLFEIRVEPIVLQTGEPFPGNTMFWKFYQLPKFKTSNQYLKIKEYDKLDKNSNKEQLEEKEKWLENNLKEQWLEFLIVCGTQTKTPDRNKLIKRGYEIMNLATWSSTDQILYRKQKQNDDFLNHHENEIATSFKNGERVGRIKGEINQMKLGLKLDLEEEKMLSELRFLKQENIKYIQEHINETATVIMDVMDLDYQNDVI